MSLLTHLIILMLNETKQFLNNNNNINNTIFVLKKTMQLYRESDL